MGVLGLHVYVLLTETKVHLYTHHGRVMKVHQRALRMGVKHRVRTGARGPEESWWHVSGYAIDPTGRHVFVMKVENGNATCRHLGAAHVTTVWPVSSLEMVESFTCTSCPTQVFDPGSRCSACNAEVHGTEQRP